MGQKFHHRHFNAAIAGSAAAMSLLVGRWSPGRLVDVAWQSYAGIDLSILLQPRHWLFPLLLLTVLPLRILRVPTRLSSPIGRRNHLFNLMACLFIYLILSTAWASQTDLALAKAYELIVVFGTIAAIVAWMNSPQAAIFLHWFWVSITAFTGFLAFMAFLSLTTETRLSVLGGGPNVFGRLMFLFAIGSLALIRQNNLLRLSTCAAAMVLVILSGSRGAMLSSVVGFTAYAFATQGRLSSRATAIFGITACGIVISMTPVGDLVFKTFSDRIIHLTFEQRYTSGREELLQAAWELWKQSPIFGNGVSGWETHHHVGLSFESTYPHNLCLELLCEGGLIALTLFLLIIAQFLRFLSRERNKLHAPTVAATAMFLIASQFSGDFFDSRGVFFCLVISPGVLQLPTSRRIQNKHLTGSARPIQTVFATPPT